MHEGDGSFDLIAEVLSRASVRPIKMYLTRNMVNCVRYRTQADEADVSAWCHGRSPLPALPEGPLNIVSTEEEDSDVEAES
jgi:hypothetical protein